MQGSGEQWILDASEVAQGDPIACQNLSQVTFDDRHFKKHQELVKT